MSFACKFGPLFKNSLYRHWNTPKFAKEVFSLHQLAPLERSAHNLGSGVIWGRGYFGDWLLAKLAARQQLHALLPFDRNEAALFGLAANAHIKPSKLVSIGAESSARSQGLARIAHHLGATFALFEPSVVSLSRFFYELGLNALTGLDLSINTAPIKPCGGSAQVRALSDSALANYLQARRALIAKEQLKVLNRPSQWVKQIDSAQFVFIEPSQVSLQLAIRLLPVLNSTCIIALRASPESIREFAAQGEKTLLERWGRQCFVLPEGRSYKLAQLSSTRSVLLLALVHGSQTVGGQS